MNIEGMRRAAPSALALTCRFASLLLLALFLLPTMLSAACVNPNPNPNPNPQSFAASGDFNGDCKSDILWQNSISSRIEMWLMNGAALGSTGSPGTVPAPWTIQGVGDFNGDGKADILWLNTSTGQLKIWLMNGSTLLSTGSPGTVPAQWSIRGIGDFNGDGKADILWLNSSTGQVEIWLMNGTVIASQGNLGDVPSPPWNILGIGDFNGDGKADILWQQGTTGQTEIWFMNGTVAASHGNLGNVPDNWSIQGVGDFNGDGKSDILWRDENTGKAEIWLMNGAAIAGQGSPGSPAPDSSTQCCVGVGNGWTIVSVGDFNGDGKADILWRELSTGQLRVWLMNGIAIASTGNPGTPTSDWQTTTLVPYGCSNAVLCNILSASNNVRANGPFGTDNPTPSATTGGALFPFVWDVGAATIAQNWASQCNFSHNPNRGGYGENIYAAGSTTTPVTVTGPDAVSDWSAESANYTYSGNTCAEGQTCGHYTQLVWRTTTAVGCAVQQCTTNSPFGGSFPDWAMVVCDYSPAGNWTGVQPY
jgi:hypothetical protein